MDTVHIDPQPAVFTQTLITRLGNSNHVLRMLRAIGVETSGMVVAFKGNDLEIQAGEVKAAQGRALADVAEAVTTFGYRPENIALILGVRVVYRVGAAA